MGTRRPRPPTALVATKKVKPLSRDQQQQLPKRLRQAIRVQRTMQDPLTNFVHRCGGKKTIYGLLLHSTHDEQAGEVVRQWQRLTLRKTSDIASIEHVHLSDLLDACEMHARDFIALMCRCAWDVNLEIGRTIFMMRYPEMMHASMERATQIDGTKERALHFQATGHVPTSKGIQIAVQQNNRSAEDDVPVPGKAPSFRQTARTIVRDLPPAETD